MTITEDTTRAELAEAILNLRRAQLRAVIPSTAAERGQEIDAALDWWPLAPA